MTTLQNKISPQTAYNYSIQTDQQEIWMLEQHTWERRKIIKQNKICSEALEIYCVIQCA